MKYHYYIIGKISGIRELVFAKYLCLETEIQIVDIPSHIGVDEFELLYIIQTFEYLRPCKDGGRIDELLSAYRSQINPNLYKVDLAVVVGRLAFENKVLVYGEGTRVFFVLWEGQELEKERQKRLKQFLDIAEPLKSVVFQEFQSLDLKYFLWWQKCLSEMSANQAPQIADYQNTGLMALFKKENKETYQNDRYSYWKKQKKIISSLSREMCKLPLGFFEAPCPGCSKSTNYYVKYESLYTDMQDRICRDNFPYDIFSQVECIFCICVECGSYELKELRNEPWIYTCLVNHEHHEYVEVVEQFIDKHFG